MSKRNYRPEIDGLRAVAVLPVVLFHGGIGPFHGGFAGVDVFFVISGYLITSIMYPDLVHGTFSFTKFYERRARRILPALFLVMAASIPFAWLSLLPMDMKGFAEGLIGVSLFVSNLVFWKQAGYFDAAAALKPLLHTWSLAVEEQFYIFSAVRLFVRPGRRMPAARSHFGSSLQAPTTSPEFSLRVSVDLQKAPVPTL
ncbi:acyltransferase [Rhizobium sophorae]|uniref:Acyltransferase n=1 Tax=Rhizobium sophorae TaxID=1535242 RepID=A0A7Y3WGD6_9HYPH|nr:acyltransferase [Rhizobium sophorae]